MAFGQKQCSLRSIARELNMDILNVRKTFFQLILNGLVHGTIDLRVKEIFQKSESFISDLPPATLEMDDIILLGALIANPKVDIRSFSSQLGLSTTDFEQSIYLLLVKRAMDGEVQGRFFILDKVLTEQQSPPNSELDTPEAVTALGYLLARTEVSFRDMAKDLQWDRIQTARIVYYLNGIGTIRGQIEGDKFHLQAALRQDTTKPPINLGAPYEKMVSLFQTQSEDMYSIKDLAKSLNISQPMVREQVSRLIGEGMLQGVLESKKFTRLATGPISLISKKAKPVCVRCGISFTESICPQCGIDTSRCVVCSKPLTMNDSDLMSCPFCKSIGHPAHLKEWVKTRGSCPNCSNRLTMEMLDPIVVNNSI
jgi:predicted DNA-binding transcriptional regulator